MKMIKHVLVVLLPIISFGCGGSKNQTSASAGTDAGSTGAVLDAGSTGGVLDAGSSSGVTEVLALTTASTDGGVSIYSFVRVNTETAAQTVVAAVPGLASATFGTAALDPGNGRYFFVGQGASSFHLYTLDARSGAILSQPLVTGFPNGLEYDAQSGQLLALTADGLVRMDPTTAAMTSVGAIPAGIGASLGTVAFDATHRRYMFIGLDQTHTQRLYVLDADNAGVISNAPMAVNVNETKYDPASGQLIGLLFRNGVEEVGQVNPVTGAVTTLSTIPAIQFISVGTSVLLARRYVFIGFDNLRTRRLYSVDSATGAVLADPPTVMLFSLQPAPQ